MRNRAAEFLALISVAARSRTHAQCSALSHTTIVNLNTWENSLEEELRTRAGTIQDASEEEIAEGRARKSRHRSFCAGRPGIEKEKRKLSFAWFSQRELPFRHLAAFFPLFLSFIHVHTHTYLIQSPVLFIFPFSWPVGLDYDLLFHDSTPLPLYRRLPFPPRRPRVYCSIGRINTRTKRTFFLVLALAHSFIRSSTHLLSYSLAHFLSFFYSAGSSTMDRHFNPFLVRRTGRTHSRLACRH